MEGPGRVCVEGPGRVCVEGPGRGQQEEGLGCPRGGVPYGRAWEAISRLFTLSSDLPVRHPVLRVVVGER